MAVQTSVRLPKKLPMAVRSGGGASWVSARGEGVEAAALGLAHHEQQDESHDDAGQAHGEEGHAPAVLGGDPPPQRRAEHRAHRHAQRIDRQRRAALLRPEVVGDQRIGRRRSPGLADADAHPEQRQLDEVGRRAAEHREQAPQGTGAGDDPDPPHPVGEPAHRDAEARVEDREEDAAQHAELRVGEAEVLADRLGQDRDDLPVQEVQSVDGRQDEDDEVAIAAGRRLDPREGIHAHRHTPPNSPPGRCSGSKDGYAIAVATACGMGPCARQGRWGRPPALRTPSEFLRLARLVPPQRRR